MRTSAGRRLRVIVLGFYLALVLAACGGRASPMAAGELFSADQGGRFVLHDGDLPPPFKKVTAGAGDVGCDSAALANLGAPAETSGEAAVKGQLLALRPEGCHTSLYRKDANGGSVGFGVLAVVFPDIETASTALPLLRSSVADPLLTESFGGDAPPLPGVDVPSAGLGDESLPGIRRGDPAGLPVTIHHVWRVRNVAVRMESVYSPSDDLTDDDVIRIAKDISGRAVR